MKVYILFYADYHENGTLYGVFSSLELAQEAHFKLIGSSNIIAVDVDVVACPLVDAARYGKNPPPCNSTPAVVEVFDPSKGGHPL